MSKNALQALVFALGVALLLGCSSEPATTDAPQAGASPAGAKYLLEAEPSGALNVADMAASAKDQQEVTVVGRIGGSANPWVEDVAAFTIVDMSLEHCAPDEGCPTPWDYCCSINTLPNSTVMVQVVDEKGDVLPTDARKLLGLKELQTIVVNGRLKAESDDSLVLLADGIHVKQ